MEKKWSERSKRCGQCLRVSKRRTRLEYEKNAATDQVIDNGASAGQQEREGDVKSPRRPGMSLIEIAMERGDMDKFQNALNDAKRDGDLEYFNERGDTALGTAILKSKLPAVKALFEIGASPHVVTDKGESALHKAVHDPNILKYLLDQDIPITFDNQGLAPVHAAICVGNPKSIQLLLERFKDAKMETEHEKHTLLEYALIKGSNEAAEVILDSHPEALFEVNKLGDTPLHVAVRRNNKSQAKMLLRKGATLSTKNNKGVTVLELISNNFYDASTFFYEVFDEFISRKLLENKDEGFDIDVSFRVLSKCENDLSQLEVLEQFVDCGQSKVLIHPLIESLLYLKWIHFLPLFYAIILVYAIFLGSVNIFAISIFHYEDLQAAPAVASGSERPGSGLHAGVYWLLIALIYTSTLILMAQEYIFLIQKKWRYFGSWESWGKLIGLVLCAATPPLAALAPEPWPRHAACGAILLVWVQAMFLISRVPRYGFYIFMFGKVAIEILKILVTVIFLVIAFSVCFMIEYRSAPPFDGPFAAFVKTLVMMSSEFDYEDLFGEVHDEQLRGTSTFVRILFLTFVIFVAIVLMNFMIGLAVSDINKLDQTGNIKRLEKQVELLSSLDYLVYDEKVSTSAYTWFKNMFDDKRCPLSMSNKQGDLSKWSIKYGTKKKHENKPSSEHEKKPPSVKIRAATLYKAIVETASKGQQKEGNSPWLQKVITKQHERIKSLVNQLAMTSHENNEIKRSIENLNMKMDNLLKSQAK